MTIKTKAKEHPSLAEIFDIKELGKELQWGIYNSSGKLLGYVRLSRLEKADSTALAFESLRGARALKHLLAVEGLADPLDLKARTRGKIFTREHAKFQIKLGHDAAYFADLTSQRQYESLDVLLEPTAR